MTQITQNLDFMVFFLCFLSFLQTFNTNKHEIGSNEVLPQKVLKFNDYKTIHSNDIFPDFRQKYDRNKEKHPNKLKDITEVVFDFSSQLLYNYTIPPTQQIRFSSDRLLRYCVYSKGEFTVFCESQHLTYQNGIHIFNSRLSIEIIGSETIFVNVCPYGSSYITHSLVTPIEIISSRGYTYFPGFTINTYTITTSFDSAVELTYFDPYLNYEVNMEIGPTKTHTFTATNFICRNSGYLRITCITETNQIDDILYENIYCEPLTSSLNSEFWPEENLNKQLSIAQNVNADNYFSNSGRILSFYYLDEEYFYNISTKGIISFSKNTFILNLDQIPNLKCDIFGSHPFDGSNTNKNTCLFQHLSTDQKNISIQFHLRENEVVNMDYITGIIPDSYERFNHTTFHFEGPINTNFELLQYAIGIFVIYNSSFSYNSLEIVNISTYKEPEEANISFFNFTHFVFGICSIVFCFGVTPFMMLIICSSHCCCGDSNEEYKKYIMKKKLEEKQAADTKELTNHQQLSRSSSSFSMSSSDF